MATGYYLVDRKNPHFTHWHPTRQNVPVRISVVHITAGLQDLGFQGLDHSAEKTYEYAATNNQRAVSWHDGVDTDSRIQGLPYSYTAFHVGNGYGRMSLGTEISKTDTDWSKMPARWVQATLENAALAFADHVRYADLPLRVLTRALVDAGQKGFISHGALDPFRRTDPGWVGGRAEAGARDTFPWNMAFGLTNEVLRGGQPAPKRRYNMVFIFAQPGIPGNADLNAATDAFRMGLAGAALIHDRGQALALMAMGDRVVAIGGPAVEQLWGEKERRVRRDHIAGTPHIAVVGGAADQTKQWAAEVARAGWKV